MMNGKRFSIPGDYAIVEADGRITLLGRGSNCINTAGEKVFPEEVEETLKTYPGVEDALVLGVPDEKWGQAITGVVKLRAGAKFDEAAMRRMCMRRSPATRRPSTSSIAGVNLRAPNGKADYKSASDFAKTRVGDCVELLQASSISATHPRRVARDTNIEGRVDPKLRRTARDPGSHAARNPCGSPAGDGNWMA